ncbi:kinesin-like protein KIN-4C [Iris pallida]|uniref:Kinesin-like protein KIN-4C n=1 Tax=Iris pallida TaxID=29817 RepID=A0AAX6F7Q5_IRIPA|nr:kinesin-like protein KIN-4C [Iris pallida]KAJ6812376.1 kinesin-like protein KIN-4C [Iris pallida]
MDCSETARSKECVKVAVNVRPLITTELLMGCTDCVTVVPGEPQVQIGTHSFTYDHVYGSSGSRSSLIFEECVAPLVDALFHGYNATVLAYGQTGSGKTYTMGTNYNGEDTSGGIIPQVMDTIYKKIDAMKESTEFLVRVSFIEIFKEEVFDLLDPHPNASLKSEVSSHAKPAIPSRVPIHIRETANGGITLAGVIEAEVRSKEEMSSYLTRGSLSRATGSTNMNSQSSRSHAIFTICLEQKKIGSCFSNGVVNNEVGDDILVAKLHLVDLAGSERAKRTGADGLRLKEGIHINRGLLALGNVISALGDEKKRKEGGHVPYRDSKLTRVLEDSLGGNSKTVMIACISPADTNAEETINTLKYANRARNIQNKAVINRDPVAAEMQRMRSQLEQLQAELLFSRGGGAPLEELQVLRHRISLLEAKNMDLHQELKERQIACDHLAQRALDCQVEKDKLILKIESVRNGKSWDELENTDSMQDVDLLKNYVSKIQQLEAELLQAQNLRNTKRIGFMDCLALEKDFDDVESDCDGKSLDDSSEIDEDEKEREHSSLQDILDKELQELDKRLEQKEAEMKLFAKVDTSVLKQHYEKKLLELEQEKKALQKEIEDLRFNLANMSTTSDDGAQKLKEGYLQKLNVLETQVSELKKKQEAQSQLLRQKQKSDDAAKRLQDEIQRIKSQKVQLQHKIKQESEQFRSWKATREKEVMQLKKEGRRNEYEMHKLMALNQRQKMVLQRKTEEASLATKRLKELLEAKKASSRETYGLGNANGPGIQALMQAIEHELEVTLRVHEVRSEYERQLEERAAMAKEVARLKEESQMFKQKITSDCPQAMSPSARSSRIIALENMLATSSTTLVTMASQLSEAEERERVFSGRGRWNQVRSLAEAKNLMNYLFNLASSSRCQLRDKEVTCREKDSIISELKEKVVRFSSLVRQKDAQIAEMRAEELQRIAAMKNSKGAAGSFGIHNSNYEDNEPAFTRKAPRKSQAFNQSRSDVEWLDDMDTSDSELSDKSWTESDFDEEWEDSNKKNAKRRSRSIVPFVKANPEVHHGQKSVKLEIPSEEMLPKNAFEGCCSCSKYSSCKTKKCECRAAGSTCGTSCGCVSNKCANREGGFIRKELEDTSNPEMEESGGSKSSFDSADDQKCKELVAHGAMLLQSALGDRPSTENHNIQQKGVRQRKPLLDIGNNANNPNAAPKQARRKNWRKSAIQLVPASDTPLPTNGQEHGDAPRTRDDVPLRLPRAMDSTMLLDNNLPFGERNSIRNNESAGNNKDSRGLALPRSPLHLRKPSEEKENHIA